MCSIMDRVVVEVVKNILTELKGRADFDIWWYEIDKENRGDLITILQEITDETLDEYRDVV